MPGQLDGGGHSEAEAETAPATSKFKLYQIRAGSVMSAANLMSLLDRRATESSFMPLGARPNGNNNNNSTRTWNFARFTAKLAPPNARARPRNQTNHRRPGLRPELKLQRRRRRRQQHKIYDDMEERESLAGALHHLGERAALCNRLIWSALLISRNELFCGRDPFKLLQDERSWSGRDLMGRRLRRRAKCARPALF